MQANLEAGYNMYAENITTADRTPYIAPGIGLQGDLRRHHCRWWYTHRPRYVVLQSVLQ